MSAREMSATEFMGRPPDLDLGDGHLLWWIGWHPDDLPANRERYGVPKGQPMPSVERAGALITHGPGGCYGGVNFDTIPGEGARWRVEAWDPLTLSPSILCRTCGDHGFIRQGKWVGA